MSGHAPRTMCAAFSISCGAQARALYICQRKIKRGRMGRLAHRPGTAGSRDERVAPKDKNLPFFANEFGRAREIPHRDLPLRGYMCKRRTRIAAPVPLRTCLRNAINIKIHSGNRQNMI